MLVAMPGCVLQITVIRFSGISIWARLMLSVSMWRLSMWFMGLGSLVSPLRLVVTFLMCLGASSR